MEFHRKLLVIIGSPRFHGNSEIIANQIAKGFSESGGQVTILRAAELNLNPCRGCLKCNKTGKCESFDDGWNDFLQTFKEATHVVIASPIYFHHLPAQLKIVLDRFRSQIRIQMTATGLIHHPRWQSCKKYAFVFSLGDRRHHDIMPAKNILTFWAKLFGARDEDIRVLTGYGLAIRRQVALSIDRLGSLYEKLELPRELVEIDHQKNQALLSGAYEIGKEWATGSDEPDC